MSGLFVCMCCCWISDGAGIVLLLLLLLLSVVFVAFVVQLLLGLWLLRWCRRRRRRLRSSHQTDKRPLCFSLSLLRQSCWSSGEGRKRSSGIRRFNQTVAFSFNPQKQHESFRRKWRVFFLAEWDVLFNYNPTSLQNQATENAVTS